MNPCAGRKFQFKVSYLMMYDIVGFFYLLHVVSFILLFILDLTLTDAKVVCTSCTSFFLKQFFIEFSGRIPFYLCYFAGIVKLKAYLYFGIKSFMFSSWECIVNSNIFMPSCGYCVTPSLTSIGL